MDFETLLQYFTQAVEAADGQALAGLFTPEGVYHDTFYGEFKGREAIREMLEERFYRDAERFLWDMRQSVCDGRTGYATWSFSYQPRTTSQRVVAEGMSRFDLENGLIRLYTESFDGATALAQMNFPPERLAKLCSRWAGALRAEPRMKRHVEG